MHIILIIWIEKLLLFQINFGGHGYGHIINNVFPKMLIKGFTQEEIDTITKTNPKTWLSY